MRKLDIGCGWQKKPGFIGIDAKPERGVDIIRDVERGLPFDDNSVDEVYTAHFLEHVKDLVFVMEEIYRVCKNKAKVRIIVPYYQSTGAVRDPTHVRFFAEDSFDYFDRTNGMLGAFYTQKMDFKIEYLKVSDDKTYIECVLRPRK